uniref:Uncharacterized protein n=1 Tax=Anguilla anguilla TaxID=7936 RepID=A0A0E9R3G8_ANGAN
MVSIPGPRDATFKWEIIINSAEQRANFFQRAHRVRCYF